MMGQGTYAKTVTTVLVLLAVEAPAMHLLLGALMDATPTRAIVQAVLLASSLYLALWLVGDLRLLRESVGVEVTEDAVVFDIGQRVQGQVARESIVEALAEPPQDPIAGTPGALRVTPMALPNCRLTLREPASLRGLYGRGHTTSRVDLYVDDPEAFVAALQR